MGADLIGYTLVRPAKGAEKIAESHITKLKNILADATLTDKRKIGKLLHLDVYIDGSCDEDEVSDADFLDTVKSEIEALDDIGVKSFYRDVNSRFAKVGKKSIEILFAGELSWGDEPQGAGYETLKRFVTLGISSAWEKALTK